LKKNFYVSDISGWSVSPYGQVLLSKWNCEGNVYRINGEKSFIFGKFSIEDHQSMLISVLHLTSDKSANAKEKRTKQIEDLFSMTISVPHSLIIGDVNFGDNEPQAHEIDWGSYVDVWKLIRPNEFGFTYDPEENTMATITSVSGKKRRLDRIFFKSNQIQPIDIQMIGTQGEEVQVEDHRIVKIYPSDHYGLVCDFHIK